MPSMSSFYYGIYTSHTNIRRTVTLRLWSISYIDYLTYGINYNHRATVRQGFANEVVIIILRLLTKIARLLFKMLLKFRDIAKPVKNILLHLDPRTQPIYKKFTDESCPANSNKIINVPLKIRLFHLHCWSISTPLFSVLWPAIKVKNHFICEPKLFHNAVNGIGSVLQNTIMNCKCLNNLNITFDS